MAVVVLLVGAAGLAGCVPIAGHMLEPDLKSALDDPALLTQLCGFPVPPSNVSRVRRIQTSEIDATRSLFGTRGHGTARVTFRPESAAQPGQVCRGSISFDFEQTTRTTAIHRRSMSTESTFAFTNIRVTRG